METKSDRRKMDGVQRKLGFKAGFSMDCVGRSGGLCLMWDDGVDVTITSYTAHHVDAMVTINGSCVIWRLTCMYGWPQRGDKMHTLELLAKLADDPHEAWVCLGDFNRLFNLDDKYGGLPVEVGDVLQFRNTVEGCGLREIDFVGDRFTWDNGREGSDLIQERIDLGFENIKWLQLFPNASVIHLERCGSDHIPIKLLFNPEDVEEPNKVPRPYRFESMWLDEESCNDVVVNAWTNPGSIIVEPGIMGKISRCAADLKDWELSVFGNVNKELKKVRDELRLMGRQGMRGDLVGCRRRLESRERELMRREEAMWLQRSRANEFKWGDQNTTYFHQKVTGRKKRNSVKKLVDDNGLEWKSFDGKANVAERHSLYSI